MRQNAFRRSLHDFVAIVAEVDPALTGVGRSGRLTRRTEGCDVAEKKKGKGLRGEAIDIIPATAPKPPLVEDTEAIRSDIEAAEAATKAAELARKA